MSILNNESFTISSDYFKAYYQIQALSKIVRKLHLDLPNCLLISSHFEHLKEYATFPIMSPTAFQSGKVPAATDAIIDDRCPIESAGGHLVSLDELFEIDCLDITGFFSIDNQNALRTLIRKKIEHIDDPKILEIGSWKGLSSSIIAFELERADKGRLYCIDSWAAPPPNSQTAIALGAELRRTDVFNVFKQNLQTLGLWERVNVLYGFSQDFAAILAEHEFDIIFIDGEHSYSGVAHDLRTYLPKLRKNGLIIGDDCEASALMLGSEFIDKHADEDYAFLANGMDVHCGVVKALDNTFSGQFELHRGASVWSKDFGSDNISGGCACPLCGALNASRSIRYGDRELLVCHACGHAVPAAPDAAEPDTIYALPVKDRAWVDQRLSMIARYIQPLPGDRIFEAGCGRGEILAHFKSENCRVAGCDLHADATNPALGIRNIAFEAFVPDSDRFDYFFAFHVLEEVTDPLAFLTKCLNFLKEGGEMLIMVSVLHSFADRLAQYFSDQSVRIAANSLNARALSFGYEVFRDRNRRIYRNAIIHVVR